MSSVRQTGYAESGPRTIDPNCRRCTCGDPFPKTDLIYLQRKARESCGWQPGQKLADYPVEVTCDGCQRLIALPSSEKSRHVWVSNCQKCNVDICESCDASALSTSQLIAQAPQEPVARSTPSARQVEHCCMLAITQSLDPVTAAARGQRYNDIRPNYGGQRVSHQDYPDPEQFGWTFTGSCEGGRAEFFEKDFQMYGLVKLDFYYTTGTVKTVLDHPQQGVTQLFAKGSDLSPTLYLKILLNPREHTNIRYHRKI